METHWSRILHHDLFDASAHEQATHPTPKEKPLTMKATRHDDPALARSPFGSAMILLGIYMTMYLAVAEVVHVLSPADASTIASGADRPAISSATTTPAVSGATGDSHATTD
jgi:hypothetical protein